MSSYDVRFRKIRVRKDRRTPYQVRWSVSGRDFSRSYVTSGLADSFRAELIQAARRGEPFDEATGLPESKLRQQRSGVTWFEHACDYVAMKWPNVAGKSRVSIVETMVTVTPTLVRNDRTRPDEAILRAALRRWAFNPPRSQDAQPPEIAAALRWVRAASVPMGKLREDDRIRAALTACATKLDGTPAAAQYQQRRRRVLYNALEYAVARGRLPSNPINEIDWTAPAVSMSIDRRVLASHRQVRELLVALSYVGRTSGPRLVAFFACLYYAMARPAEALGLREHDCELPDEGWGRLELRETEPSPGKLYTDDGKVHQRRGLKNRPAKVSRLVPIPPALVAILRAHIRRYGVGADGRLFRSVRGAPMPASSYWRTWKEARQLALTPAQVDSPLASRPYDLRHAGVTGRLNAGVPATQVAEWAGHSVEVLYRIYAGCIDGQERVWFDLMERGLDRE